MSEEAGKGEVIFNQAAYQQQRLNERFLHIERLNTTPLHYDRENNQYNYEIMFNELVSCYVTISAELSEEDDKLMEIKKKEIEDFMEKENIFFWNGKTRSSMAKYVNRPNWNHLNNLLFQFRKTIEQMMKKHGFGNPSKSDPTKAVVGN